MIQHVTRTVHPSQLDACVDFYGLLGFEPVPAPPGIGGRAVWLQATDAAGWPGGQIHLMHDDDARVAQGHIAVVLADYDAALARLRAAGHEVEPRREHWGSPRAYVHDPAGNLVEVMAWPPE